MSLSIVRHPAVNRCTYSSIIKHHNLLATRCRTAHTSSNDTNQNVTNIQLIFREDTPKQQSVKRAKKVIAKLSNEKCGGLITDPKLEHFLSILSRDRVPNNLTMRNRSRQIYSLMIRNKITDDEIYEAIQEASRDSDVIVNVKLPKSAEQHQSATTTNLKQKSLNGIQGLHPQEENQFNKILEKIERSSMHHTNDLYQILSNLIEESNELQAFQSSGSSKGKANRELVNRKKKTINLQYLEDYLTRLEDNEKQKNLYIKKWKRVYDWGKISEADAAIPSGGQLLFNFSSDRNTWLPFRLGNIFNFKGSAPSDRIGPNSSISPSKYLLLNLNDGTKDVKIVKNTDYSLYSINYRDLLGIVNSVGGMHEDVLAQIRKVEADGWVPIGNLYDEPKVVVFKRNSEGVEATAITGLKLVALVSLVLIIPLGSYYLKSRTAEGYSEKQKQSNQVNPNSTGK